MRKENASLKRDLAAARKVVSETKEKPSEAKEKAKSAKEINSAAPTKPARPAKPAKPTPAKKPRPKKPAPLLPNELSDEQREHIDVIRAALKVHIIDTGLPNRCLGHMINVGGTENKTVADVVRHSRSELKNKRMCGKNTFEQIEGYLAAHYLRMGMDIDNIEELQ